MKKPHIILAGGSGFLGRVLADYFQNLGYDIVILTRSPKASLGSIREVSWDARTLGDWSRELEGAAAIINLTGRTVDCRYTAKNKKEILKSRVDSTHVIGQAISKCEQPPSVWLNASTATIYPHTLGVAWDEAGKMDAAPASRDAFSVEVAFAWEKALNEANTPRTRKVALRTSMVLGTARNSVFPVLCRLTRFGLGGKMGSGQQYVSWIHQTDFCRALHWIITHDDLSGPINLCAPNPLPNHEMMRIFRQVCGVPFGLPATEWMLEIGAFFLRTETELILKSRRVISRRLKESGFEFQFPELRDALNNLCG